MEGRITAIKVQKRNHERVSVYLDGEYAFGLARIVAAWLEIGQYIDERRIAKLIDEDEREVAYQQALKFLNYRERSEGEVRQNLNKHDLPEDAIEAAIKRLRRSELVDDEWRDRLERHSREVHPQVHSLHEPVRDVEPVVL